MARMKVREASRSTRARASATARIGILALCGLLLALVADPRSALADAAVTPASGGTELVVGTSAPLSGPYVTEAVPGDIGRGAITLQTPPGFEFDTSQYVTAMVTNEGNCSSGGSANDSASAAQNGDASTAPSSATPAENQPLLLDGDVSQTVTPTQSRITVRVTQTSSGDCRASIEWSGISIIATAEGSGSITKARGGSVISGVTDGSTDFGWLSATASPQEETAAPRSSEPTPASAEPEEQTPASAEPEEPAAPPGLAPEEGTALTPELEKTDAEETTGLEETTGEPTSEPTPEEESSGVVGSIREEFASLISGFTPETSESSDRGSVSEGTATGVRAPAKARSVMEPSTDYSQVVDNASPGRFSAPGWGERSEGGKYYGEDYAYVEPSQGATPARFKVKIPTSGYYTVYAWWPSAEDNSAATRFGVSTTSGVKWTEVNQQTDGGMWVRIGAYKMQAGDRYAVQVSPGSEGQGSVIADAVMVVSGTQVTPPEGGAGDATMSAMGDDSMRAASSDDSMKAAGGRRAKLKDLVKVARWHIGTRYRSSPPNPCRSYRMEDCSCHTKVVFKELSGKNLPDDPVAQWRLGRKVSKSELRPGDLVFFKEGRSKKITHVGFYSGNGNIVHASGYWGKVVERPMKYVSGYSGAKRLKP